MKVKCWIILTVVALFCSQLTAGDLRLWTDVSGQSIEAVHVRTEKESVVLRTTDGSEVTVGLDTLSERDRNYALSRRPHRIGIEILPRTDAPDAEFQAGQEVIMDVVIRKNGPEPIESPLKAEVYVIGQPATLDSHVVLARIPADVVFVDGDECAFSIGPIDPKECESELQKEICYRGNLVVIRDGKGEQVELKCSRLSYEKHAEAILSADKGTMLSDSFRVILPPEERSKAPWSRKE